MYLAAPGLSYGVRDLQLWHVRSSSLIRDRTLAPCTGEHGVLAIGPPGKTLLGSFTNEDKNQDLYLLAWGLPAICMTYHWLSCFMNIWSQASLGERPLWTGCHTLLASHGGPGDLLGGSVAPWVSPQPLLVGLLILQSLLAQYHVRKPVAAGFTCHWPPYQAMTIAYWTETLYRLRNWIQVGNWLAKANGEPVTEQSLRFRHFSILGTWPSRVDW